MSWGNVGKVDIITVLHDWLHAGRPRLDLLSLGYCT